MKRKTENAALAKFVRAVEMVLYMIRNSIPSEDLYLLARQALSKPIRLRSIEACLKYRR
jgi:hypothetical protein